MKTILFSNLKGVMSGKTLNGKKLTINSLSRETGISRQSLTALYKGTAKGIEFKTLEKLTNYFDVPITDIINKKKDIVDVKLYKFNKILSKSSINIIRENKDIKFKGQLQDLTYIKLENLENKKENYTFTILIHDFSQNGIITFTVLPYTFDFSYVPDKTYLYNYHAFKRFSNNIDKIKMFYIKSRIIASSNIIKKYNDHDKITFSIGNEDKALISKTKKEIMDKNYLKSFMEKQLSKYDLDKNYSYRIIDKINGQI